MAEVNKTPNIEQDINTETQQQTTGVENTTPVSSISEPVQTPQTAEVVETQQPVITTQTEKPQQVADVNIQPEVAVQPQQTPQEEVKVEEIKPITQEAPKQATTKIETAQDIKTQEIANEDLTNQLNEKKKSQVMQEFQNMVQSGATLEEMGTYWLENKQFHRDIANILRSNFKNTANTQFFGKYSTMNNEDMYAEYQQWNIVPWSEQYNMLPAEKKASFENFLKVKNENNIIKKTDFSYWENITNMSDFQKEIPKMFSSSVRSNYESKLNSKEIISLSSKISWKKLEIEKLDIEMEDLVKDMKKNLAWNLPWSISAEIEEQYDRKVKDKRLLYAEYNAFLWEYQSLKLEAETELKLSMYEDEQARQDYQTQLSLYETRRKEQFQLWLAQTQREQELEDRDFALKTQLQAEQRQQAFTKEMKELDQKLKNENPNGTYQVDRDWNMLYLVNGKATKVRDADWKVVWVTQAKDYNDTVQKNTDGTYSIFRTYNDWRKPEMFNYGINWESTYNTQIWVYDALAGIDSKPWRYFGWEAGKLQCWEAVNRYLKWVWITDIRVWDSYKSKKDIINNNVPQVGWLAIWNPVPEWEFWEFWHIWVVTWYNPDRWEVEITDWNKNGNWEKNTYTIPVSQVLNSDWGFRHLEGWEESLWLTSADIATFNNSTFKPQDIDNEEDRQKYQSFLNEKARVYNNPQADMSEILEFSRWGKPLTDTSIKALEKFDSALNQIWEIQEQIQDLDTWPIVWRLKNINPYDTDAQTLKAQLTALIPNLARGVYWEVGVLTDNDVRLYSQTIPNLTSTSDTNDAVLAMTLKVVAGWYKRQLQSLAASWKDVSWFEWLYQNLTGQVEAIENRLWISWNLSTIDSLESEFNSWENTPSWVSESQSDYSNILWF